MESLLAFLLIASAKAAALVLLVLVTNALLSRWIVARWRYLFWGLVAVRLVLPPLLPSGTSLFNLWTAGMALASSPTVPARAAVPSAEAPALMFAPKPAPAVTVAAEVPAVPPLVANPVSSPSSVPASAPQQMMALKPEKGESAAARPLSWRIHISPWLAGFALWLAGVAALLGTMLVRHGRLVARVRRLAPVSDPAVLALLDACRAELNISGTVVVVETPAVQSPALLGILRPRLLLPAGLAASLGHEELRHVILHELAHFRRRDIAVNWLMALVQALHWFNPFVWLAFHRMRQEQELACDETVLAVLRPEERRRYGHTLLALTDSFPRHGIVGGVGILESTDHLVRRLEQIRGYRPSGRFQGWLAAMLFLGLGALALTEARPRIPPHFFQALAVPGGTVVVSARDVYPPTLGGYSIMLYGPPATPEAERGEFLSGCLRQEGGAGIEKAVLADVDGDGKDDVVVWGQGQVGRSASAFGFDVGRKQVTLLAEVPNLEPEADPVARLRQPPQKSPPPVPERLSGQAAKTEIANPKPPRKEIPFEWLKPHLDECLMAADQIVVGKMKFAYYGPGMDFGHPRLLELIPQRTIFNVDGGRPFVQGSRKLLLDAHEHTTAHERQVPFLVNQTSLFLFLRKTTLSDEIKKKYGVNAKDEMVDVCIPDWGVVIDLEKNDRLWQDYGVDSPEKLVEAVEKMSCCRDTGLSRAERIRKLQALMETTRQEPIYQETIPKLIAHLQADPLPPIVGTGDWGPVSESGLVCRLTTDRTEYRSSDKVFALIEVKNQGSQSVMFGFYLMNFDVSQDGRHFFRLTLPSSAEQRADQSAIMLLPGATRSTTVVLNPWNPAPNSQFASLRPGKMEISASIMSGRGQLVEATSREFQFKGKFEEVLPVAAAPRFEIAREKCAALGVSVQKVAEVVGTWDGKDPKALEGLTVEAMDGKKIRLLDLGTIAVVAPQSKATGQGGARPGVSMDDFFKICASGNADQVKAAIMAGADVNAKDKDGKSPLMVAAGNQNGSGVVPLLLEAGAEVHAKDGQGDAALMRFSQRPCPWMDPQVLPMLLRAGAVGAEWPKLRKSIAEVRTPADVVALAKSGANLNAADGGGWTPLMLAVALNQPAEVVSAWIESGAGVNARDKGGLTPLMLAAQYNSSETVAVLLHSGAKVNARMESGWMPLTWAVWRHGDPKTIKALLQAGAQIDPEQKLYELSPLSLAARGNPDPEVLQLLLGAGAKVDAAGQSDEMPMMDKPTPLMLASAFNTPEIVRLLLQAGADPKNRRDRDKTPLMLASQNTRHPEIVSQLIRAGAEIEARNQFQQTPLLLAARYNSHPEVVKTLLQAGAEIEARDHFHQTPLLLAARNNGHPEVVKALLQAGAKIEAQDSSGATPLMLAAAYNRNLPVLDSLLRAGAKINAKDSEGRTSLMCAIERNGNPEIATALIQAGADTAVKDKEGRTLLQAATKNANPQILESLLRSGADANSKDGAGRSLLLLAARDNSNPEVVLLLLHSGAEINAKDNEGQTPLMAAVKGNGVRGIVESLLRSGAEVNAKDGLGRTALHQAAKANYYGGSYVLDLLLKAGAEVNARDNEGRSALDGAKERTIQDEEKNDRIAILLKAGAK